METALDRAHAAMQAAPDDDAARLRFFERLADCEFFLLLTCEPQGDELEPETFTLNDGSFVLGFDREERLAGFVGRPAPYVALSGRALAAMLRGKGMGLGVNLGSPSETLLPTTSLDWLAETLQSGPVTADARPQEFFAPKGLPERLIEALSTKLALAEGLARQAYLAAVSYDDGRRGHMLAFLAAIPEAEAALARAVSEALIFSGIEAGELDVTFLTPTHPAAAALAKVALRFDIPRRQTVPSPAAPGRDPDRPPKLR